MAEDLDGTFHHRKNEDGTFDAHLPALRSDGCLSIAGIGTGSIGG